MRRLRSATLSIAAILLALLALDVYLLLLPGQVEQRLRHVLATLFRTPFSIGEIRVSLRSGISIRGLSVQGPEGERALAVEEATVAFDWRRLKLGEVRIRGPLLDLRRDADGRLSLLELLNLPAPTPGAPLPELPSLTIRVEDAHLRFRDAAGALAPGQVLALNGLDLEVQLAPDEVTVRGAARDPIWKEATFAARIDLRRAALRATLDIRKARMVHSPEMRARIPPMFWGVYDTLRMHGTGDLAMRFRKDPGAPLDFRGEIQVHSGGLVCAKFPYPAEDATGTIRLERDGDAVHLILEGLHGAREGGTYRCDGDIHANPKEKDDVIDLRFAAENLPLDRMLADALPPGPQKIFKRFALSGRGSARVRVTGNLKPKHLPDDVHISVDAAARDVEARFLEFPVPAHVSARVSVRDERFAIEELAGTAAGGELTARGAASPDDIDIRIEVRGAKTDEKLRADLLPDHRAIMDRIAPRGEVDVEVDVTEERDPATGGTSPTFAARLTPRPGLEARFADFPYPVTLHAGESVITPVLARIDGIEAGAAEGGPHALTLTGTIRSDARGGGIEIALEARDLPVDDHLRSAALGSRVRSIVAELGPERGAIDTVTVTARSAGSGAPLEIFADARLRAVALRPARAPLPFRDLAGRVRISPGTVELDGVEGRVLRSPVRASGAVSLTEDAPSSVRLTIERLELDEELRAALPGRFAEVWAKVRPQGTLALEVRAQGGGAALRPEVRATLERGALLLAAFPLAATGLSGEFYVGNGMLRLDRLAGKLGEGALEAYGFMHLPEGGGGGGGGEPDAIPRSSLRLTVRDVPLDERLIDAFPEERRKGLSELKLRGKGTLEARLLFDPAAEPGGLLTYLAELRVARGSMDIGLELSEVEATVRAHGAWPIRRRPAPEIRGGFAARRAVWKGQELERFGGRFSATPGLFEVREIRGEFLGGALTGNFYSFGEEPRLYGAELALAGGRLERWAAARYSGKKKASGLLEGDLSIIGEGGEGARAGASLRGEGTVRVKEGRLWELPIFAGLLNTLSLELPGKPVFDDAYAQLRLESNRIVVERAEISSAALSFYGTGTIVEGIADLRLTHELGRNWLNQVPIFGPVWRFVKGNFVEIEIRGPIDEPKILVIPVKVITDPARWLFERRPPEPPK